MTEEETPEIDPDDEYETVPIEPKRIFVSDFLVLGANFARHLLEAMVLSASEFSMMFAAHANYKKAEQEKKEAVETFMAELNALPTASK